jgi:O-antigen/teichoic acid export membrane protein
VNADPFSRRQLQRVGIVASGNFAAAALGFVLLVILTRALPPTDFTIVVSIIAIIDGGQLFLDAMFNPGIVSVAARDEKDGAPNNAALRAGFFAKGAGGILFMGIIAVLAAPMSVGLFGDRSLTIPIVFAGAAGALAGMQSFIVVVLQARGEFARIPIATLLKNLLRIAVVAAFVFLGHVGGQAVAAGISATTVVTLVISYFLISWDFMRDRSPLRRHFTELQKINGWMMLTAFGTLGGRLDLWLVAVLSDTRQAGLYAVASQLCVGVGLVTQALITTFLPAVSQFRGPTEIRIFMTRWLWCIPLLIFVGALAWLVSDPIIPLVFGSAYSESAPVFNVLFAASLMTLVGAPLMLLLLSFGEARIIAAGTIGQFIMRIAFALPAIPRAGALGVAVADIASRLIAMTLIGYFIWVTLRRYLTRN